MDETEDLVSGLIELMHSGYDAQGYCITMVQCSEDLEDGFLVTYATDKFTSTIIDKPFIINMIIKDKGASIILDKDGLNLPEYCQFMAIVSPVPDDMQSPHTVTCMMKLFNPESGATQTYMQQYDLARRGTAQNLLALLMGTYMGNNPQVKARILHHTGLRALEHFSPSA